MYFFHIGISISSFDHDLGNYSCVKILFETYNLETYLKACVALVKELEIFRVFPPFEWITRKVTRSKVSNQML
jgi:hypothetical protein